MAFNNYSFVYNICNFRMLDFRQIRLRHSHVRQSRKLEIVDEIQFNESSLRKKVSRRAIASKNNTIHKGNIITHAKDTAV